MEVNIESIINDIESLRSGYRPIYIDENGDICERKYARVVIEINPNQINEIVNRLRDAVSAPSFNDEDDIVMSLYACLRPYARLIYN